MKWTTIQTDTVVLLNTQERVAYFFKLNDHLVNFSLSFPDSYDNEDYFVKLAEEKREATEDASRD